MSLHKLTAGSGYDYLTRQIAVQDATEKGHSSLSSYYSEKGEAPRVWVGSGLAGIEGIAAGDVVTAEQMHALFAYGFHPLADERVAALEGNPGESEVKAAQRLGTPYRVYENDIPPYQIEVARRIQEINEAAGRPRDSAVSIEDQARVHSEVAREYFVQEHGREPADARELAATVAKQSRDPLRFAIRAYGTHPDTGPCTQRQPVTSRNLELHSAKKLRARGPYPQSFKCLIFSTIGCPPSP